MGQDETLQHRSGQRKGDFIGLHRRHGRRVPGERRKLHFVGRTIPVNMHDRPHVACFQTFGWNGGFQNNAVVFFNHVAFHILRG
jgi:hypothetical protein